MSYRHIDADKVVATARVLARRVEERFAQRGLADVADEVVLAAEETREIAAWLEQPLWAARLGAWAVTALCGAGLLAALAQLNLGWGIESATELVQGVESLVNDVVFAGVAVWYVHTIESQLKRRRAMRLLRQLRALAHVIDRQQLAKDPDRRRSGLAPTEHSPDPGLEGALLARYLDYCTELLALLGKLAALMGQGFDDHITLATVDELEDLTTGLSRKVWQKIVIIDRMPPGLGADVDSD